MRFADQLGVSGSANSKAFVVTHSVVVDMAASPEMHSFRAAHPPRSTRRWSDLQLGNRTTCSAVGYSWRKFSTILITLWGSH